MCEHWGVPVDALPEEGLRMVLGIPADGVSFVNLTMTPLVGAINNEDEDLAIHLLTLPGQALDLDHRLPEQSCVLLHFCAGLWKTRVVKELVRLGAIMDLWDNEHHTPLCLAAGQGHLPVVRFFLEQYRARGASDVGRAILSPCLNGLNYSHSLLGHVLRCCDPVSAAYVATARYLVKDCGVDPLLEID